jgi:hypothetical protein
MADIMIDIETLGTGPAACIITIAAQVFDPLIPTTDWDRYPSYYARIDPESQPDRTIEQNTLDWWAIQPQHIQDEAFGEHADRVDLKTSLTDLGRLIWHSKRFWANGPTFDANIIEHAFKSYNMALPWQFWTVRDARTVYSLWPNLPKPTATHNALDDCRRQIVMLHNTLQHLGIKELV